MNGEREKRTLLKLLEDHPESFERARQLLLPDAPADLPEGRKTATECSGFGDAIFEMSIHEDEFNQLVSGCLDPGAVRSVSITPPDKITFFEYADKVFEVFFYIYNAEKLGARFERTLLQEIYETGKIKKPDGSEAPIYPWAVAADLGVKIHDLVLERNLESTLEIGLAYGLSALFICEAHRRRGSGSHVAIDPGQRENFSGTGLENIRRSNLDRYFSHLDQPDYRALPDLLEAGRKFDLIFIDGLHLFDYVLLDFFYADLLLNPEGFVAFDDSTAPGVGPVINFIETNRNYARIESPIERLSIFQKLEDDRRFLGDPSGFSEFLIGRPSQSVSHPPRTDRSHDDLVTDFVRRYHDLIDSGRIAVRRPWAFELRIEGERSSAWRIGVSQDGVESHRFEHDRGTPANDRKIASPPVRGAAPESRIAGRESRQPASAPGDHYEKIAVVGVSARHPRSPDIEQFWENLLKPEPMFSRVPADRWSWKDYYGDPDEDIGKTFVNSGGFVDDVYRFDAEFFGVSPREAALMDPQQRLLLEEVYKCVEDSGYSPEALEGPRTGVFIAMSQSFYLESQAEGQKNASPHVVTGDCSFTANRISYYFNFGGPSESINTACSSYSVALHRAAMALQRHECDVALVGTASLEFSVDSILSLSQMGVLSQDGTCAPFNEEVSGLAPGEAVGVVMLKRLDEAVEEQDNIYGTIAGSGTNHAGNLSGSLTMTNSITQINLINGVLAKARIGRDQIDYVEGHGTGGHGDALELDAIRKVFAGRAPDAGDLCVGSVKSFVGFSGPACGLTQLIKVLMMMKHGVMIPTLGFNAPPSNLDLKRAAISIPTEPGEWGRGRQGADTKPRRAGIHSYGLGGSGAFLVIEEWIDSRANGETGTHSYVPLSARTEEQLETVARRLATFLRDQSDRGEAPRLADLSGTLQSGRKAMEFRLLIPAESVDGLRRSLDAFLSGDNENEDWFRGRRDQDLADVWAEPGSGADPAELTRLWLKGMNVDWRRVRGSARSRKISLPTYPFQKEIHRFSKREAAAAGPSLAAPELLRQSSRHFVANFEGDEPYLVDHVVGGKKLLPGAISLEIARAAFANVSGASDGGRMLQLSDVVLIRPVVVEDRPVSLHVTLTRESEEETTFEIFEQSGGSDDRRVHVRGSAAHGVGDEPGLLDLAGLQARICERRIGREECYAAFRAAGIDYGESLQCIREIHTGQGEVLAHLQLPGPFAETHDAFALHPSLIDATFQALLGVVSDRSGVTDAEAGAAEPFLPFAFERIDILKNRSPELWVWIRPAKGDGSDQMLAKHDIDVCGPDRRIGVRFRGLLARAMKGEADSVPEPPVEMDFPRNGSQPAGTAGADEERIRPKTAAWLKGVVASVLGKPVHDLAENRPLETYGLDSILIVELTKAIKKTGLGINTTLFFEERTIEGLVGHLIENHRDELLTVLSAGDLAGGQGEEQIRKSEVSSGAGPAGLPSIDGADGAAATAFDIAIIGLAGRYPQARDVDEFWRNLKDGENCITEIPPDRWDWRQYFDEQIGKPGCHYTRWGGFLDDVDKFDARFFGISPREAGNMDPQERLFLEVAYASVQDAGYTPADLSAHQKVGVFVGVMNGVYSPKPSNWSIANRVSYLLDFRGPSLAVDTACSSSLTAIHLAAESLYSGLSECAIAGGVNLIIDPIQYIALSEMTMLSRTDQCRAFGDRADGFVDGEGVGAVLLKPLKKAVSDGDRICGVLKGSMLNSDGRTGGYSVPNPKAQSDLVSEAAKRAGVSADTVSYLEAHGTATALGDPIEISALTRAFQNGAGSRRAACAIGSVKSNIGHCESAAGIAGVTKVLMQMKHGQLAPSLHSEVLNPHIDFEATPFVVNRELRDWQRPVIDGKTVPRRAGISSFGAGGANAHVIIEEFIDERVPYRVSVSPGGDDRCLVVLSAKTEERLEEATRNLLHFVRAHPETALPDLAYTLQVGRETMEERMGFPARTLAELESRLETLLDGRDDVEDHYRGQAPENPDATADLAAAEEGAEGVEEWIGRGDFSSLLASWVKGLEFDWNRLYGEERPRRISLPTYPFAKERFWLDRELAAGKKAEPAGGIELHPFQHENAPEPGDQCFTSTFDGAEFFLADHQVQGRKVLPGVAYLEMARAAFERSPSERDSDRGSAVAKFENITWSQPFVVKGSGQSIRVALSPRNDGRVRFEMYTPAHGEAAERILHCQGLASHGEGIESSPRVDLPALKARMNGGRLAPSEVYESYESMGIRYGSAHRAVASILIGDGELLAKLVLPEGVKNTAGRFVLHPSLLDASWQASIGFVLDPQASETGDGDSFMPFALDSLEVFGECSSDSWAWIRKADAGTTGNSVQKLDIDLCDGQGVVRVRMKRLSSRPIVEPEPSPKGGGAGGASPSLMTLTPVWESVRVPGGSKRSSVDAAAILVGGDESQRGAIEAVYSQVIPLSIGEGDSVVEMADRLGQLGSIDHVIWIAPENPPEPLTAEAIIGAQEGGLYALFRLIKALVSLKYGGLRMELTVITAGARSVFGNEDVKPAHSGIHGMIGSLADEYPHWRVRLADIGPDGDLPFSEVLGLPVETASGTFARRSGEWFRQSLVSFENGQVDQLRFRKGGVYVAIGGAGGIGAAWSRHMVEEYGARVIWIGRREKDETIARQIEALSLPGDSIEYVRADASDRASLSDAYDRIKQRHPAIHGVVHSAVELRNGGLENLDEPDFRGPVQAKIDSAIHLAEVFEKEHLDFMLFFSSMVVFGGQSGTSNYAAGCCFVDEYASYLGAIRSCPVKVMNWGYWGSVGIKADPSVRKSMSEAGIESIEPDEGIAALECLMSGPVDQVALVKTTRPERIETLVETESVAIYPRSLPSVADAIRQPIPEDGTVAGEILARIAPRTGEMEDSLVELLWAGLRSVGLFDQDSQELDDLRERVSVLGIRDRWFEESLRVLLDRDYLRPEGGRVRVIAPPLEFGQALAAWHDAKIAWKDDIDQSAQVVIIDACAPILPEIIIGNRPVTEVLFPNSSLELVEGIYAGNSVSDYFNSALSGLVCRFVEERVRQDPNARIRLLEIGAGTGATSAEVLRRIRPYEKNIGTYCFTDLSDAFLNRARERFGDAFPFFETRIFDVSEAIAGQGIPANHYDLVIATNVLHATDCIRETLRNAKAAMKHNGLLMLNELSGNSLFFHLSFAFLEGWWLYDDSALRIPGCPGLSPETWSRVLEEEGFGSVSFPEQSAHELGQQLIIAESDGIVRQKQPLPLPAEIRIASPVRDLRKDPGPSPLPPRSSASEVLSEEEIEERARDIIRGCIAEVLKMALSDIEDDRSFSEYGIDSIVAVQLVNRINDRLDIVLQTTVLFDHSTVETLSRFLTVTHGDSIRDSFGETAGSGHGMAFEHPGTSEGDGARLRPRDKVADDLEDGIRNTVRECVADVLKISKDEILDDQSFSEYGIDSIVAVQLVNQINERFDVVLQTTILFDHPSVDQLAGFLLVEYAPATGAAFSDSLPSSADTEQNSTPEGHEGPLRGEQGDVRRKPATFRESRRDFRESGRDGGRLYRKVILERPGEIDDLQIVEESLPRELGETDVRISVCAVSMNFGDLLCVRGLYPTMPPYPFTPGFDAAGIVEAVGSGVTCFRPGDAVVAGMGKTLGAHATVVTCPEEDVHHKHPKLSFEEACALPIVTITMIDAFKKANLQPGERILIQTAAGGTGLIAVQLALHAGGEIFATASSQAKLDYLKKCGVHHLINYHEKDFESEVVRITGGEGVDVVINTLAGDGLAKGMRCLAPGGRYIELAMTALKSAKAIDLSVLCNNQSFFSVDLRKLGLENPVTAKEYRDEFSRLLDEDLISATIQKVFEFDEIREAYRALQDRGNIGKIVVRVPDSYRVEPAGQSNRPSRLATDVPSGKPTGSEKEAIAIIGMSGRFAQSEDLGAFWTHLAAGENLVKPIDRWDLESPGDSEGAGHYASLMDGIDQFDPRFFRISGVEAKYMDPQQRLFLEQSWIALEDAGYAGESIEGSSCGVYVGCAAGDYQMLFGDEAPAQAFWGNANSLTPSRIAYYLNLRGPAVVVDTGCSSSLVAIHLACQGLWSGEIETGLAGGVFVQCTPAFHLSAHRAGMLSPEGKCRAFDEGANGFVSGEGVGVIVLKRLSDALDAGDHIHGVIRGSGINQDGHSNGITAPSIPAQERLEREVYQNFGIDPSGIQMIEAHGTGTEIGDPIEFEALNGAFRRFTDRENYCALGSVKTNVGHTTSAAGVAGVLRILLSLKHQQIPPSLHYETGNPRISFDKSPFFVNTELRDWNIEAGEARRAAVSSFSFGGTNAHIVIEEAPQVSERSDPEFPGYLVPLSAQSPEQLRRQIENLAGFCRGDENFDLGNLSHTLVVGRRHWDYRWACVARDRKELVASLESWLEDSPQVRASDSTKSGRDRRRRAPLKNYGEECLRICRETTDAAEYLERIGVLADLYVQGYALNFGDLFGNGFSRISLPGYPFSRERCWIDESGAGDQLPESSKRRPQLHPLLHQNTSGLSGLRFTSDFTGRERFWRSRKNEPPIFPGLLFLEMARAAFGLARAESSGSLGVRFEKVTWGEPAVLEDSALRCHIELFGRDDGAMAFEISSERTVGEEEKKAPRVHVQGIARLEGAGPAVREPLVESAQGEADAIQEIALTGETSEEKAGEEDRESYGLSPRLLESVWEAIAGSPGEPTCEPAALEEFSLFETGGDSERACFRRNAGTGAIDIELRDGEGKIRVRFDSLTLRTVTVGTISPSETLAFQPVWKPVAEGALDREIGSQLSSRRVVLLCEAEPGLPEAIEARLADAECLLMKPGQEDAGGRFLDQAKQTFLKIRDLREEKPDGVLLQVLGDSGSAGGLSHGLAGLLKTARLEFPALKAQFIAIAGAGSPDERIDALEKSACYPEEVFLRYENGRCEVSVLEEIPNAAEERDLGLPWKAGGVYLITGGAGGLGRIVAREIESKVEDATVILAGRSEAGKARIDELAAPGLTIDYRQADVGNRQAVDELIRGIVAEFETIDGVIHAAGIHQDRLISNKEPDELENVLSPKVSGVVNLDLATKDLDLDFFICFSSCAAVLGNPGQADYAAANAFLDAYAAHRNELAASGERRGRSLSINWPLWKDGGMQIDADAAAMIRMSLGMVAMDTASGVRALYRAWNAGLPQVFVIGGDADKIRRQLVEGPGGNEAGAESKPLAGEEAADLTADTEARLKGVLAEVIGVPEDRIDPKDPLEDYGIDSLMIATLNQKLSEILGEISKTLFFEFQTLDSIVRHLVETCPEACMAWSEVQTGGPSSPSESVAPSENSERPKLVPLRSRQNRTNLFLPIPSRAQVQEPIAIIGVDGRYPQAENLEAYWKNLEVGKDCVTEIPADRWPLDDFFHPDVREAIARGKSYSKWGSFLEGFADFDPLFFKISPIEAINMDPQERLFLQSAWNVVEEAGYTRETLAQTSGGRVGVFAGITKTGFELYGPDLWKRGELVYPRTSFGSVANRISYFLNLEGPSMPIDTMCSSSLTAIHEACEHIRRGECEMAIAGGVNLYLHPSSYVEMCAVKMLSRDGKCRSFGKNGNGFVPGEGVGTILLKSLESAIEDGDHIHAVIRGSSVNHGGKTNGYTVPNPNAQAKLIRETLDKAGIDARKVSYIEAHGTGTELGDPIEMTGLTQAFRQDTEDAGFCALGSAKSNLGHLEAAAGIAGLTKVLLQMKHGQLAPSLHAREVNPNIAFAKSPFVVQQDLTAWERPSLALNGDTGTCPRIAGISSFGAGGANAHLLLEEYRETGSPKLGAPTAVGPPPGQPAMIPISAKNPDRLRARAASLLSVLEGPSAAGSDRANREKVSRAVTGELRTLLAGILRVEARDIGDEQSLQEFGVEMIQQMQLLEQVQDAFQIEIPWNEFRDLESVASMGAYLVENHPGVLDADDDLTGEPEDAPDPPAVRLEDFAYTLQVGREAMEERAGMIVTTLAELVGALRAIVGGGETSVPTFRGRVKRRRKRDAGVEAAGDEERDGSMERMIARREFSKILEKWVTGGTVDWELLYPERKPRRISLPGYPFGAERFWPDPASGAGPESGDAPAVIPSSNGGEEDEFDEGGHEAILDRLISRELSAEQAIKLIEGEA